ncbi:unnamed protein product, partial [Laminaria digitata]
MAVGCRGQEDTLCWRGAGGGSGGSNGGGSGSERQQRAIDSSFGTIASRLRFAHGGGGGGTVNGPGEVVGCGQVRGGGGGGGCDDRSSGEIGGVGGGSGSGGNSGSGGSSADWPRFTRGRANVIVHAQQGRTTSHPREHGHTPSSRTLPLAGDSPTPNHGGGHVANGVSSSRSAAPLQVERRGGRFGSVGGS